VTRKPKKIVVRELASPAEFHAASDVAKAAWKFADRSVPAPSDLIATSHAGGLTGGAFEGKTMLGFVHGIPRNNMGQPCQHSHLLAVLPEAQGRGLSVELKLFQRRWCLARGIALVTWTYDPFLLKNAKLNMTKLRASARAFLPNFYGHMGGIYHSLPTDRFEVIWRLDDPLVEHAAMGEEMPPPPHDIPDFSPRKTPGSRVAVRFPAGAPDVYRTELERSLKARRVFAKLVTSLFDRGYEATAVTVRADGPAYVFDKR